MKHLTIDLRWIDASGVGTYITGILPGIVEQLADVAITGLGDRTRLEQFPWASASNVRMVHCNPARYSLGEQWQLPRAIPADTDLFFSPYYTIPFFYRGPLAATVHDLSHLVVAEIVGNPKKRIYAQIMFRALRKRALIIFTVSAFSKAELLRLTRGPREDNILSTHLGLAREWYSASSVARIRAGPYFVHVGNIKPYKNLGRLVEAFLQIRDRIPHDLVIVGQSEGLITGESPDFFERVRKAGDRIHMTGFVSHQELLSHVSHAEALLMPSLYEGFGLPPLEAMAAGVPAVVARAASLPEVCADAALYFDPLQVEDIADKLLTIATDSRLRAHLIKKGLERSMLFTWELCSTQTSQALRETLYGPRVSRALTVC